MQEPESEHHHDHDEHQHDHDEHAGHRDHGNHGTMDMTMMNTSTIMTIARMDTGTNMAASMPTCTATKRGCAPCRFQQQGCFS